MPNWLNRKTALYFVGFVAIAIAGFFGLRWMISAPLELQPTKSLEVAWGDAIGQFRIEPVFPPEEDLAVGDVLAYVIADRDAKDRDRSRQPSETKSIELNTPSLKRSVKIAHLDVRRELEQFYGEIAVFPGKLKVSGDTKQPSGTESRSQASTVPRLFSGEVLESDLPRAAFARVKSAANVGASGSLAADGQASAAYSGGRQASEEFHLSEVSTYGLPSGRALKLLKKYCAEEETKDDCRESAVRGQLQHIIGSRIDRTVLDEEGNVVYAVDIGLVVVTRVYQARSIVHRRQTGRTEFGSLLWSWFTGGSPTLDNSPKEQPSTLPSEGAAGTTSDNALKNRIAELEKQLRNVKNGGGFSAQSSANDESDFNTGLLERPVVFGFRYARLPFPREPDKAETAKK
ncbi:MAG: hypothetical protein K2Y27_23370 [Xanthobacteraceae bacterium]|nr:hypothetical protein [Xanthobacteraceae bacterium]